MKTPDDTQTRPSAKRPRKKVRRPTSTQRLGEARVTVSEAHHPRYKFLVVLYSGGKRLERKWFKTKAEAETKASEYRNRLTSSGVRAAAAITGLHEALILEANEKLAPYGKTLRDALDHYLDYLGRTAKSITTRDLIDRFLQAKRQEKKSERYMGDLRVRLDRFAQDFGTRNVAEVTGEEISAWLSSLNVASITIANFRRILVVAFNYAVEHNFAFENPAAKAIKPTSVESEIGILTPGETANLLAVTSRELIPLVAVGCFAGVREAELMRLDWRDIDFEGGFIEIKPSKAKSARRRLIVMRPNLRAWLEPHRKIAGPVAPYPERKTRQIMQDDRRRCGFGTPGTETEAEKHAGIKLRPWPHNAARHSFASYGLAKDKDLSGLALEMGHNSTAILFQHYRELVRPKAAEAYWKIVPGIGCEVLKVTSLQESA